MHLHRKAFSVSRGTRCDSVELRLSNEERDRNVAIKAHRLSSLSREVPTGSTLKHSVSTFRRGALRKEFERQNSTPELAITSKFSRSITVSTLIQRSVFKYSSSPSPEPYGKMLQARPGTGYQPNVPTQPQSPSLENITFQHLQETASKRISTLGYLRKAHEGCVYWFNTLLLTKPDIQRVSNTDARKLARRATNLILLGLSLPTILDLYSSNPTDFLKTLNILLSEFESFQQVHPPEGTFSSSLSRGRFPQMFRRATAAGSKGRRTSSAADLGHSTGNDGDSKSTNGVGNLASPSSSTSFPGSENDLLPGEEYTFLLTPSLPFDPDIHETFATLCDVLIDCYTKLMSLVSSPRETNPTVAELFTKADARIKKLIIQSVVKEMEDSSRAGVRNEIAGISKVVLGGLILSIA